MNYFTEGVSLRMKYEHLTNVRLSYTRKIAELTPYLCAKNLYYNNLFISTK